MKRTLAFIGLLTFAAMAFGCANCENKKTDVVEDVVEVEAPKLFEIDQVVAGLDESVDQLITVEGLCTHICQHGGRKIFLMGSDDSNTLRIQAADDGEAFKTECVNSMVEVTGYLREERIDEAYLAKWEEEIKAETAEQHGEVGEEGCATEMSARGEEAVETVDDRIDNFRQRIAERKEAEGKEYLSFYFIDAESYKIK